MLSVRSGCTFPSREVSSGTRVSAARRLKRIAITITAQNCRRMSETSELVKMIGRKTTTKTMVTEMTVMPISFIASQVARTRFFPISIWR